MAFSSLTPAHVYSVKQYDQVSVITGQTVVKHALVAPVQVLGDLRTRIAFGWCTSFSTIHGHVFERTNSCCFAVDQLNQAVNSLRY